MLIYARWQSSCLQVLYLDAKCGGEDYQICLHKNNNITSLKQMTLSNQDHNIQLHLDFWIVLLNRRAIHTHCINTIFISRNATVLSMMLNALDDIYNCDFSRIENLVVTDVHDKPDLSGKITWQLRYHGDNEKYFISNHICGLEWNLSFLHCKHTKRRYYKGNLKTTTQHLFSTRPCEKTNSVGKNK